MIRLLYILVLFTSYFILVGVSESLPTAPNLEEVNAQWEPSLESVKKVTMKGWINPTTYQCQTLDLNVSSYYDTLTKLLEFKSYRVNKSFDIRIVLPK